MPVRFVLGRAGTGKTRHCLDTILSCLAQPDDTHRLILLVPEQASFQMERALALGAPRRGFWRAEVLSFSRLARRVLNETGIEPETLRPSARAMALRCILADPNGPARAFGKAADRTGLLTDLSRFVETLLAEGTTPDALRAAAEGFDASGRRRVESLAAIAEAYLEWVGSDRIDPAQRLAVVRARLATAAWLPQASIWVDGFAGFTGQELETLVALAKHARHVTIALLVDPAAPAVQNPTVVPDPLNLFAHVEQTYQQLLRRCEQASVPVESPIELAPRIVPRFKAAPQLAQLEAALAEPFAAVSILRQRDESTLLKEHGTGVATQAKPGQRSQVRLLECGTHDDELHAAARYFRERIRTSAGHLRPRDFALIGRDLTPFAERIKGIFAEYGVPCFLDRRRSIATHALARFVDALLEVLESDFAPPATLRLLRSGLLPIERRAAECLQNGILAEQPRGLAAWRRPRWTSQELRGLSEAEHAQLDEARRDVLAAIEPLLVAIGDNDANGRIWSRALYDTLTALAVPERIEAWIAEASDAADFETAEIHRLAWDALCRTCDDIYDALAEQPLTLGQFAATLRAALREETIGLAPPTQDQVLISSIERSRHPEIKCAWIFGFNDGLFPAAVGEDPLLPDTQRAALVDAGVEALPPRQDQSFAERMLAYIALTRPTDELIISYATTSDDGTTQLPSPLLDDVRRTLPEVPLKHVDLDHYPACLDEFVRQVTRNRASRAPTLARCQHLLRELQTDTQLAPRLDWLLRGRDYHNIAGPPVGLITPGLTNHSFAWFGSITQIESYLACPFQYLARYALDLRPPPAASVLRRDLGREAHEILASVVTLAMRCGDVRTLPDDEWGTLLTQAIANVSAKVAQSESPRQPQDQFASESLHKLLEPLLLAHAARWRRGGFEPIACERRFGELENLENGEGLPPLQITVGQDQTIVLRGIIDRVDAAELDDGEAWLIYDYKSFAPAMQRKTYLTGTALQLFTYGAVVEQAGANKKVGGILVAPIYVRAGEVNESDESEDADQSPEQLMMLYRPRGLFDASLATVLDPALSNESKSPVAAMQLKKDGTLRADSDAKPRAELESRIELARRTIAFAATGILAGEIDIAPLVESKTLACRNCDYAKVCRFEQIFNRPRRVDVALPNITDVISEQTGGTP